MVDKAIVETVAAYLGVLEKHDLTVSFAVVYGSYLHGKPERWSDIDILVVSPQFDDAYSRSKIDVLWKVAAKIDSRIEPVPCGCKQWEEDDVSVIIEVARREGYVVHLKEAA